ncbi:hypothetical protein KUW09_24800 [Mameliella alba]|nr:hypothetical protein [Antarctobacter heliothermus]MBY6147291.1 hypothetical protein [Mameliella alba]MCA0957353.1 hypothetical protein [Mameliella alba]
MDEETPGRSQGVYLHFDGINQRLPFSLGNYGDDGALTEDQVRTVAVSCDLDTDLARDLSVLLGYALDLDTQVNLVRVKPVEAGKRGAIEGHDCTATLIDDDGNEVQVKPLDKRKVQDARRLTVVESCCYIWLDAGQRLTFTTRSDKPSSEQRAGPLVDFIQTVIGMITSPSCKISGETLRRDIEQVKYRFRMRGDLPDT